MPIFFIYSYFRLSSNTIFEKVISTDCLTNSIHDSKFTQSQQNFNDTPYFNVHLFIITLTNCLQLDLKHLLFGDKNHSHSISAVNVFAVLWLSCFQMRSENCCEVLEGNFSIWSRIGLCDESGKACLVKIWLVLKNKLL